MIKQVEFEASENISLFLFMWVTMFAHFSAPIFIFLLHSSRATHSMLLILSSLTPVVTSWIHEFHLKIYIYYKTNILLKHIFLF